MKLGLARHTADEVAEAKARDANERTDDCWLDHEIAKMKAATDLETVAAWIGKQLTETGRPAFSDEEIAEATGVDLTQFTDDQVMRAVYDWLASSEEGLDYLSRSCEFHSGKDGD